MTSKKSILHYLTLTTSVAILGSQIATAATTITTADGIGADTFIQQNSSGTNFGNSGTFNIKDDGNNNRRMSYLRFDLGSSYNQQATITDADLTFTLASSADVTFEVYGLTDGTAPDNRATGWGETTVTWNSPEGLRSGNAPSGNFTSLGTFDMTDFTDGALITFGANDSNTISSSGFSDNLNTFLQSDTNGLVSFAIIRSAGGSSSVTQFYSKNSTDPLANDPSLSFANIPEPGSYAFGLGIIAIGLVAYRQRNRR